MTVVHARNPDRSAEAAAVIRLPIAWLRPAGGLVEERIRVQRLVPESPEAGPMHLVLTGTHDEVEHSSARSAEFRRQTARLDLEFLQGLHGDAGFAEMTREIGRHRRALEQHFLREGRTAIDARRPRVALHAGRQPVRERLRVPAAAH